MFPPHSLITRVSSWTIPVRSLPIAETAKCCFICALTVESSYSREVYREQRRVATAGAG
jgi:hypothetical protein